MQKSKLKRLLLSLGPGILFASTAIGVSHLVQSTRAGAEYGFALLWAVLLANILKYPFFEFGSRYANAKNSSIIDGYDKLGKYVLHTYIIVTIGSMFFVSAAVGYVTIGFLDNLFGISKMYPEQGFLYIGIVLFISCGGLLIIGRFSALDRLIKVIGSFLLISTLVAFFLVLGKEPKADDLFTLQESLFSNNNRGFFFLIALMGWMPTAVDLSAWNSLWTVEKIESSGYHPTMRETLFDFNFGYLISAVLSICFVAMGAILMYGQIDEIPKAPAAFAHFVVTMYTSTIGQWSYYIIAIASFCIMFGTCIAVLDGYSRAAQKIAEILRNRHVSDRSENMTSTRKNAIYNICLLVTIIISLTIIIVFKSSIPELVDLATIISFVIAPFIAIMNYILVTNKDFPKKHQPKTWLKALSILGIIFLTGFSFIYLYFRFFA